MGPIKGLFYSFIKQIFRDGMLIVLIPTPFLMGIIFRYALPFANRYMQSQIGISIEPYYIFSDLMLVSITPLLSAMVSAFVLLDERDEGITLYYKITPATGWLYFISRLLLPALWSFIATFSVVLLFSHVIHRISIILLITFISILQGVLMGLIIVKLSNNKVEGLAVSKLMAFVMMGFIPAYAIMSPVKYLFGFLPGFWIGEIVRLM